MTLGNYFLCWGSGNLWEASWGLEGFICDGGRLVSSDGHSLPSQVSASAHLRADGSNTLEKRPEVPTIILNASNIYKNLIVLDHVVDLLVCFLFAIVSCAAPAFFALRLKTAFSFFYKLFRLFDWLSLKSTLRFG